MVPTLAQSALVAQAHGASTHTSTLVGLDDDVALQLLPLTTLPVRSTHRTLRPRLPGPHECASPYAFTALQVPHDDVVHSAMDAGHANRLHGRTELGGHTFPL